MLQDQNQSQIQQTQSNSQSQTPSQVQPKSQDDPLAALEEMINQAQQRTGSGSKGGSDKAQQISQQQIPLSLSDAAQIPTQPTGEDDNSAVLSNSTDFQAETASSEDQIAFAPEEIERMKAEDEIQQAARLQQVQDQIQETVATSEQTQQRQQIRQEEEQVRQQDEAQLFHEIRQLSHISIKKPK